MDGNDQSDAVGCDASSTTASEIVDPSERSGSADTPTVRGSLNTQDHDVGKLTVLNVGKHVTCIQLEKLLKKNGIIFKKAKKPAQISHAVLSFETVEQRTEAMRIVRTLKSLKGTGFMKPELTHHGQKRASDRRATCDGEEHNSKRLRQDEPKKSVAQATASLYGVKSYEEQLAYKENVLRDELFLKLPVTLRREWEKRLSAWKEQHRGEGIPAPDELRCPDWCRGYTRKEGKIPFEVLPIVPSPEQEEYRNKCEFTLGAGDEGGRPTTGFRASKFQHGMAATVESPVDCPQVHRHMKRLCVQMDAIMRNSPFPVYDGVSGKSLGTAQLRIEYGRSSPVKFVSFSSREGN